ncbi:MAG: 4-(cytidine 5'-diphospho)-2-C-methyl-D-erythritol kinase, partial [Sediminibacterium sp.]
MIAFPNCKINLGLHITEKREDGYHNLQTIFYPVPWCDIIELIHKAPGAELKIKNAELGINNSTFIIHNSKFKSTGLPVPGDPSNNLCIKAWELLKKDYPQLPSVYIHLHKIIPMGAGLGGGSSDGAFV